MDASPFWYLDASTLLVSDCFFIPFPYFHFICAHSDYTDNKSLSVMYKLCKNNKNSICCFQTAALNTDNVVIKRIISPSLYQRHLAHG